MSSSSRQRHLPLTISGTEVGSANASKMNSGALRCSMSARSVLFGLGWWLAAAAATSPAAMLGELSIIMEEGQGCRIEGQRHGYVKSYAGLAG